MPLGTRGGCFRYNNDTPYDLPPRSLFKKQVSVGIVLVFQEVSVVSGDAD